MARLSGLLLALKGIQWLKIKFCVQNGHIKIILCLFIKIKFDFQKLRFLKIFQKIKRPHKLFTCRPACYSPAVQGY